MTKKNDKDDEKKTEEQKPLPRGATGMYETRGGTPNATPSEQRPENKD